MRSGKNNFRQSRRGKTKGNMSSDTGRVYGLPTTFDGYRKGESVTAKTEPMPENAVPLNRQLTKREFDHRLISTNAPCGCGSGAKFKDCRKANK
jgi:hypothetical protein